MIYIDVISEKKFKIYIQIKLIFTCFQENRCLCDDAAMPVRLAEWLKVSSRTRPGRFTLQCHLLLDVLL